MIVTLLALLVFLFAGIAIGLMCHPTLKSFAFTAWVFTFVAASMAWPRAFATWFGFDLKNLIVPLVQIIMFGMGTKLSGADFLRVIVMPWPVFGKKTDRDLTAIYEYLRSLPSLPNNPNPGP